MKRRVIQRVVVFLLLLGGGAIVNVAVAWGFSVARTEVTGRSTFLSSKDYPRWVMQEEHGLAWQELNWRTALRRFDWKSDVWILPLVDSPPSWTQVDLSLPTDEFRIEELAHGFPMLSVATNRAMADLLDASHYFIVWPGFAINTIFYAAMLWLLFSVPLALRRRRRMKRGLCPACAYPVGTSSVCTECGKQLA